MEPQQSPLYANFMKSLRWHVESVDGVNIFLRKFPFMGGMMKIHRPEKLPNWQQLLPFIKTYNIKRLVIEPVAHQNHEELSLWCKKLSSYVSISRSPFLPTKTILVDLTQTEDHIFQSFSEAKRRAVRRAQKNNLRIEESTNISELIQIKNRSGGVFGFIATSGLKELWNSFYPKHAVILLAYSSSPKNRLVSGILLLFWKSRAYYWIAGASRDGKKLFAPTLLVWEALKLAKKKKCKELDFVGVWDERIPKENTSWAGFTKFKEGFGGATVYYPLVRFNSMLHK
jgi:lipid II:glycine glycyltransferase (peptidoglycan interpeptide bridge formation enzyme)